MKVAVPILKTVLLVFSAGTVWYSVGKERKPVTKTDAAASTASSAALIAGVWVHYVRNHR